MFRPSAVALLAFLLLAACAMPGALPRGTDDEILPIFDGYWQGLSRTVPPGHGIIIERTDYPPAPFPLIRHVYLEEGEPFKTLGTTEYKLIGNDYATMTSYLLSRSDEYRRKGDYYYQVEALTYHPPDRKGDYQWIEYEYMSRCYKFVASRKNWDSLDRAALWAIVGPKGRCNPDNPSGGWSGDNYSR